MQVVGQSHLSRLSSTVRRTTRTAQLAIAPRHARTTLRLGVRVRRCLPGTSPKNVTIAAETCFNLSVFKMCSLSIAHG